MLTLIALASYDQSRWQVARKCGLISFLVVHTKLVTREHAIH